MNGYVLQDGRLRRARPLGAIANYDSFNGFIRDLQPSYMLVANEGNLSDVNVAIISAPKREQLISYARRSPNPLEEEFRIALADLLLAEKQDAEAVTRLGLSVLPKGASIDSMVVSFASEARRQHGRIGVVRLRSQALLYSALTSKLSQPLSNYQSFVARPIKDADDELFSFIAGRFQ